MSDRLLTVHDLAERLGLSVKHCYLLIERGEFRVTRIGTSVRVTEEALAEFIAERTAPPRRSRKGAAA